MTNDGKPRKSSFWTGVAVLMVALPIMTIVGYFIITNEATSSLPIAILATIGAIFVIVAWTIMTFFLWDTYSVREWDE